MKFAVLSLSGGMDSSSLLIHLLANDFKVVAISFDYGQKHSIEIDKAKSLCDFLNANQYHVDHHLIKIDGLGDLLHSTLVSGGDEVPEGHYHQDNMKLTVVPNRNKIFSSIIQAAALSIADSNKTNCMIAMGIHSGDHHIYPDCREAFRELDYKAFLAGNYQGERVQFYTPYIDMTKETILKDLDLNTKKLKLDSDEILKRTITSYKPILINGQYYSDYKSASSVGRIEAFIKLGRKDPIDYADEKGEVSWDVVENHVKKVCQLT